MVDMDRLFELLDEASHAVTCNCPTTTAAYVKMARTEWFRLIDETERWERDQFRSAALFIDSLVTRQLWNGKPSAAARNAHDFWMGYEGGVRDRTQPRRASPAFRRGYRFGKEGH